MRRLSGLILLSCLSAAAAWLSLAVAEGTAIPPAGAMPNRLIAAAAGLVFGLLFAWVRGISWPMLAEALRNWRIGFLRQIWWVGAGGVALAVLVYY